MFFNRNVNLDMSRVGGQHLPELTLGDSFASSNLSLPYPICNPFDTESSLNDFEIGKK